MEEINNKHPFEPFFAHQNIKQSLFQSLRKERELANRITVLFIEKERKLKHIHNHMKKKQKQNSIISVTESTSRQREQKTQVTLKKGFQVNIEKKNHMPKLQQKTTLVKGKDSQSDNKLSQLYMSKKQKYQNIRREKTMNEQKIQANRQKYMEKNKRNKILISLMENNSKENIKKYWAERTEYIRTEKQSDLSAKEELYFNSLKNRSILEKKQQTMLIDLQRVLQIDKQFSKRKHTYQRRLISLPNNNQESSDYQQFQQGQFQSQL